MPLPTRKLIPLIALAVLAAAGYYGWRMLADTGPGAAFISGNGRIEATEIDVATKLAGRVQEVLVTAGDGDMMMGIGSLATIAAQKPENLSIVVMDNGLFEEKGRQSGLTASGVDIAGMEKAAGFRETMTVTTEEEVAKLKGER